MLQRFCITVVDWLKRLRPKHLATHLVPSVKPDPHASALLACLIQIGLITMLSHAQLILCLHTVAYSLCKPVGEMRAAPLLSSASYLFVIGSAI